MRLRLNSIFETRSIVGLLLGCVLFGTLMTSAAPVRAQAWLEDRDQTEGAGIRTGNLEIHPGVGAEVGFDSNVYNMDASAISSAILRITPHLSLSTLGSQRSGSDDQGQHVAPRISFRAGLSGSLYYYLNANARTDVGLGADLALTINPEGRFSFGIVDQFTRSVRPFVDPGGDNNYAYDRNNAGVRMRFGTAGRIFEGTLDYTAKIALFESGFLSYANNLTHQVDFGTSWRFLPHTALIYDFRLENTGYLGGSGGGSGFPVTGSTRLRTRLGVNGVFTPTFSMTLSAGYAGAFVPNTAFAEKETAVGQLELRFRPSATSTLKLGYSRELENSILGVWRTRDRGYLNYQMVFGRAFLLGAEMSAAYISYGTTTGAGSTDSRQDVLLRARLFSEYRFNEWLAVNATVVYTGDITSFQYTYAASPADPADYQKLETWLGMRVFY